jgi:hypothetical protein
VALLPNQEFSSLFAYLAGKQATPMQTKRYAEGVEKLQLFLSEKEQAIVAYLLQNPSKIAVIDTGIALFHKNSNLHQRIWLIAALAECSQENIALFLNKKQFFLPLFHLFLMGTKAICLAFCAFILFTYKQWK